MPDDDGETAPSANGSVPSDHEDAGQDAGPARHKDGFGESFRLATSVLTIFPVRKPARFDREIAGTAMALTPLIGLGVGLVAAAVAEVATQLDASPLLAAALAIAALAVISRAIHLDGLADTA